jgi:hypothetical protein
MENLEEETIETEEVQSSSEPDYKALYEETKSLASKKEEEAARLKEQLRKQSETHTAKDGQASSELAERLKAVENRLEVEEKKEREQAMSRVKTEDWYQKQYSSESDPDGKKVSRFSELVKLVDREFPPTSIEDRVLNYKRAELILNPEVSQTFSAGEVAGSEMQKRMAGGAQGGGSMQHKTVTKLSEAQIKMAIACGNRPEDVYGSK